jgi:DNA polymerase-3 subunit delta
MAAKKHLTSALDYLTKKADATVAPVCAVVGDDRFLKREVLTALRRQVLGDDEQSSPTTFEGNVAELRDVRDALATLSLFGGEKRMVVVEGADPLVSNHRAELEEYAGRPHRDAVLVLDVKTWPSNTRLAKVVAEKGMTIDCSTPKSAAEARTWTVAVRRWLTHRAETEHGVKLLPQAIDVLLDLLPQELGILDQEIAKLALLADDRRTIDAELVRDQVGGWRTRTAWEMIDAAAAGDSRKAIAQLDRLLTAGEEPIGILAQMSSHLRKFATATAQIDAAESANQRLPLSAALKQAGVLPFKLRDSESQLKQIGRIRARQINRWLLSADMAMKGHNSAKDRARLELERLIVKLGVQARPETSMSGGQGRAYASPRN